MSTLQVHGLNSQTIVAYMYTVSTTVTMLVIEERSTLRVFGPGNEEQAVGQRTYSTRWLNTFADLTVDRTWIE